MFKKYFIITVFSFLYYSHLYSQTPSYYHYTSNDGLASSTVYDIIQDKEGFIWFATANGMSKFSGKHFKTFRVNEGLNSNSIISLLEGENGELYIANYEKGINVLRNGRIEKYCTKIEGKNFITSYLIAAPGKNVKKLYAYHYSNHINSISKQKSGGLLANCITTKPFINRINRLVIMPSEEIIALTKTGLFNFKKEKLTKISIAGLPETEVYCLTQGTNGNYFIGTKGIIYKIKDNAVVKKYPVNLAGNNKVSAILRDKHNNIWFSIMNKGFYFIGDDSDKIIDIGSKMGLQNTLVNKFFEDKEGNIWVSTFGKGVFCLNNLYLKSYNETDGLSSNNVFSLTKESPEKLLIGTYNGVNILENGKFDQIKSNSTKTLTEYIYSIQNFNNDFYICRSSFAGSEMMKIPFKGRNYYMINFPSFCKTKDGLYLFGTSTNSIKIKNNLNFITNPLNEKFSPYLFTVFSKYFDKNRVNVILEDTKKNVWIGTAQGLCKANIRSTKFGKMEVKKLFFPNSSVLTSRINAIIQDNKNKVWFAGEKGVSSYNFENKIVKDYKNIKGYDLSSSTSIVADNKNRIWIGNMKGLYLFDRNTIKHLSSKTGFPADEILTLYYDTKENMLYVGTSSGISLLDVNLFDSDKLSPPNVKIISIKAGDSVYTSYKKLVFEPKQNDVEIDFKALYFSSPGSIKYRYKLDKEWIETDDDFLNFIKLKNGKYELQIMAKAQNTSWGKPCLLSFRILPQFSETIWFDLLIISLIVFFTLAIVIWRTQIRTNKIRKKIVITERINQLEHKALSAMMNPHFISNSLNSVQYLVNSQRYEEANDYIAMMSKLMRKNLDTAGSGFILLSEEIYRLKLYLDLEKLRFQESFSYEIFIGSDVDPNTVMIPNMIVQPFVENSLWHGIINSGHKGLLTVSFTFEDVEINLFTGKSLIIKVTDNGIGIIEAKKHKKEDHISKGIEIIEERLRLLSEKMHLPQPIMFEDLKSRNNMAHGTEVIILLPLPLYKIIIQ